MGVERALFGHFLDPTVQEITQDIRQMQVMGRIEEVINIYHFINPPEEAIGDTNEDIMNDLVSRYTEQERFAKTDEEVEVTPVVTVCQVQETCRILRLHVEQQLKGDIGMLRQLRRHERRLFERRQNSQKKSTLSTWVVAGDKGGDWEFIGGQSSKFTTIFPISPDITKIPL